MKVCSREVMLRVRVRRWAWAVANWDIQRWEGWGKLRSAGEKDLNLVWRERMRGVWESNQSRFSKMFVIIAATLIGTLVRM